MSLNGLLYKCIDDMIPMFNSELNEIITYIPKSNVCILITHRSKFAHYHHNYHEVMFDGVIGRVHHSGLLELEEEG